MVPPGGVTEQAPGTAPEGASLAVGVPEANVAVAEAASETAPPLPAAFTMHTVAEGETLTSIGEQHAVDVQYLVWNNPEVGTDPDMLAIGEDLIVPGVPGIIYDVRLGDTLIDIAATYSIEPSTIVAFAPNKLASPDLIVEGSVLVLPGGVPPAPAPPEETPAPPLAPAPPPEAVPAPGRGVPAPAPAIVRAAAPVVSAGFIWPVNGPINSGFGLRWGSMHTGIDIGVGAGTPVASAASGQVVLATTGGGFGYYIIVRHADGLETLYAHLSGIYVSLGQYVGQGEIIGASGCSGWCTGPHLHFEVHVGNTPVNPLGYLP